MMDFNDLEHNALAALALSEVRASLRAQYRYVFIDEYQDAASIRGGHGRRTCGGRTGCSSSAM